MAGEVTETVKGCMGCLFLIAIIYVVAVIGYFALNIILYLIPVVIAVAIGLAPVWDLLCHLCTYKRKINYENT